MYEFFSIPGAFCDVPVFTYHPWYTPACPSLSFSSKKPDAIQALQLQKEACDANVVLISTFVVRLRAHRQDPKLRYYLASATHSLVCHLLLLLLLRRSPMHLVAILIVACHRSTLDALRPPETSAPIHFAVRPRLRVLRPRIFPVLVIVNMVVMLAVVYLVPDSSSFHPRAPNTLWRLQYNTYKRSNRNNILLLHPDITMVVAIVNLSDRRLQTAHRQTHHPIIQTGHIRLSSSITKVGAGNPTSPTIINITILPPLPHSPPDPITIIKTPLAVQL